MAGLVKVLPAHVVDQIAAGEVVERPASVLKELLENAIDAGASQVVVRASGGGVRVIEVSDDGCGMDKDDALEALKRHATSKIRSLEDLNHLVSLGFRGEALSSIASVSRLELVTRTKESDEATKITVEGGHIREVTAWGAPVGTRVRVESLFYNMPARRKFLRSEATEAHHLKETLERIALVNPRVSFQYHYEDRSPLQWPAACDWAERVGQVVGRETFEQLFPVPETGRVCRISGYLSHPNYHKSTSAHLWFYVNQRPVQDRGLLGALLRGYGQLLARGRYPVGVVRLEIPRNQVDVNVHPAKREVRFRDPRRVQEELSLAVRRFLREQPWLGPVVQALGGKPQEPSGTWSGSVHNQSWLGLSDVPAPDGSGHSEVREPMAGLEGRELGIRFLGQLGSTYLVFATPGGLLVVDQHAAHERILFEELSAQAQEEGVPGQGLLLGKIVELKPHQEEVLEELRPALSRLGWRVEPFGPGSWRIGCVPHWMDPGSSGELLEELLEAYPTKANQGLEALLASLACRSAVKAGKHMEPSEAMELLNRILRTPARGLCPHGRPAFIEIQLGELDKRFARA